MTSRTSKRFAIDTRLVIGLALVAASITGVVGLVAAADSTIQVVTAGDGLTPGDRLEPDELSLRSVRLDAAAVLYLSADAVPTSGLVVTRAVSAGELVPRSAVGTVEGVSSAPVVIEVTGGIAASVGPHSVVDVWASREVEGGLHEPPAVIVAGATVVRLVESDSIVAGDGVTAVEVLVPRKTVARVLASIANADALAVVPAGIPVD